MPSRSTACAAGQEALHAAFVGVCRAGAEGEADFGIGGDDVGDAGVVDVGNDVVWRAGGVVGWLGEVGGGESGEEGCCC